MDFLVISNKKYLHFFTLCLCFGSTFLHILASIKLQWTQLKCKMEIVSGRERSDTDYEKWHRYALIPLICVEGGHYKLKCFWMLFIWCPVRVMNISDSEPTASSRYPALHLQMLPGCMSCPLCTEAVIHSNATRNKLKYWHAPCPTGRVCMSRRVCLWRVGGSDEGSLAIFDG